ncbi:DnaJ family molecular chaperone [Campylobacter hepaticus]|uniref:DnaJ family molecular chaperone n=1 Tax=Campylobacter hepaticus TaxID=1813019 RepID=UPI0018C17E00|nr:DnaJ family molecular chaperone [Campylobacter hepaticus]MDX2330495.1 DnaJ family molecular chaperone [Campylobacter hepaticus]MDX2371112.1 DnaJ family molecular chaperone [Campylobacter hepaticus]MDX2397524.1 DnaJ family molecular chaperone [Campylobacter hepaticus]MDX5508269.1 DnaJ family molecular chaperone [Campylobacter hepaticus]QOW63250.1 DnaJ family molecular chaperone [Campylobacter hepaticus]
MILLLIILSILAFYWYYKTWGKQDFLNSSVRGVKGFTKAFKRGVLEERMDALKRRMNYYVIALLAKIAKSDGRVSQDEANMIKDLLDANAKDEQERAFLKASFNEHKENLNDTFYVAKDFLKEVPLPKNERFNVLRVLVFMALIDGSFSAKKREILEHIARAFDIAKHDLDVLISSLSSLKNTNKELSLDEAYKILELSNHADLNLVKKQYRLLAKKYHPDILSANNVSEEELKKGVEKFQKINEAYEKIKKHLER